MKLAHLAIAAVLAITPAALLAQAPDGYTINQRKENQQDRIAQVFARASSPRARLPASSIGGSTNREEHRMRASDNGHLTRQDRRIPTRQQKRDSRSI